MKYVQTAERTDGRTRDRVTQLLLERGPATAAALGSALGLSPAAVRRHLDALLTDGVIEARDTRPTGSRGRPAKAFALTAAGRDGFRTDYDDLAADALRFLAQSGGPDAVAAFAQARVAELEARYRESVGDSDDPTVRAQALAEALSGDGYAASASARPTGVQLCQHHCPVASVATEFPQLCEAETAVFSRLLGTHVQRLATISHGDGICTTHVPFPSTSSPQSGRTPA